VEVSIQADSSCCRFTVGIIAFIYICFLYIYLCFVSSVLSFSCRPSELRSIDLFISHLPSIILCSINLSCLLFDLFLLLVIESNCRSCLDMLLNCLWKKWNRSFCAVSGKRSLLLFKWISQSNATDTDLSPWVFLKFNYVVLNACLNVPESLENVAKWKCGEYFNSAPSLINKTQFSICRAIT